MAQRSSLSLFLLLWILTIATALGSLAFFWETFFRVPPSFERPPEEQAVEDAVPDEETAERPTAGDVLARDGVLVIAHRGASHVAPENTLPAFRAGVEAGADFVELDYRHSEDDRLVVLHDKTLDRTTDAVATWGGRDFAVAQESLARLRALDAGAWFDARFAGARLPTLDEALQVIQPGSLTLIERKAGDAAALVTLLRREAVVDRVVVQAFDWDFLAELARLEPRCRLAALGSKELSPDRLERLSTIGVVAIGWSKRDVTAGLVSAAHGGGLEIWVYTVDDTARAQALVALGVDGIITNRPAEMRAALRR
jgi:glycerophosphoryl diester phosphodiesterase